MSYTSFSDEHWQSYVLNINNPASLIKIKGYNILVLLSDY